MNMSAQDGCSGWQPLVPAATVPLLGDASGSSGSSSQPAGTTRCRPLMPKRTSFPCMACGRNFPTQQAMAGHCSAHNRTRIAGTQLLPAGGQVVQGFGHHGLPGVQGSSATNHTPALVLPYPSFLPFIHPMMSSQVIRGPSCLGMHGPSPTMEIWPVLHQIQAPPLPAPPAHLFQGPVFQPYSLMPMPCHATMGVVPRLRMRSSAYSADQPGAVRDNLALQLGCGGGNSAQKRTLLPLLEDGRRSKRAAVVLDGGDGGRLEGEDTDDLDLELRL
ncbi:unnamed protein product [Urochloa decumbens]|uniref:C2H2-type domain-containing protein n=1 Tax=Urochloa decumbens TaxID=240449 RepID=A0ABC9DXA0_9POAL